MSTQTAFEGGKTVGQFADYYEQVRGNVREVLARSYLLTMFPELEEPGQAVVDVGGGEARDAVWLAELGHSVTVVEPSKKMIKAAERRLEKMDSEVAGRITLVHASGHEYALQRPQPGADFAFSHGVMMYLPRDQHSQHVHDLMDLTHENGRFSLLTKAAFGATQRLISHGNDKALARLQDRGEYRNNLKGAAITNPYEPEDLVRLFQKSGVHVLDWFGVREVSDDDGRKVSSLKPKAMGRIIEAERKYGMGRHTKGAAHMLHVFAAKQAPNLVRPELNSNGLARPR